MSSDSIIAKRLDDTSDEEIEEQVVSEEEQVDSGEEQVVSGEEQVVSEEQVGSDAEEVSEQGSLCDASDDDGIGEEISEEEDCEDGEEEDSEDEDSEEECSDEEGSDEEGSEEEGSDAAIADLSDSDDDFQGDEGEHFGEYRLLKRLGKGGYSVVWKAQKNDEEPVALKIGKQNDAEDLEQEIEALKRLGKHPNVLTHLDDFAQTIDGVVHRAIVFKPYQCDLKTHIAECEGVSLGQAKVLFRGILRALRHVHEKGVVHTDLKPENILVTLGDDNGIVDFAVTDFGSSCWEDHHCKGGKTYGGRSFQVVLGEVPQPPDDIWTMGCVLFEMVTGQYLFDPDKEVQNEVEDVNRLHLLLMAEVLGPFPKKLALRHRKYFNAKGSLKGNPRPAKLDLSIIFEKESDVPKANIPELCSTILSMLRYVRRQRPTVEELLQDPFLAAL